MKDTIAKYAPVGLIALAAAWYTPEAIQAVQAQATETQEESLAPSRRAAVVREASADEERILPKTTEGKTAVGMVFAAFGWFMWSMVRRQERRGKAEGDLDTRLPLILQSVTGGWEKLIERQGLMIDAAETRAARATEEREALMNKFIDYATTQQAAHDAKIDKMQAESAATYKRMDDRLNECLSRDKMRDDKVDAISRQVSQLDQKQFQAALVSTPAVVTPLVPHPARSTDQQPGGATVTLSVPAGGLSVSPSVAG